MSKDKLPVNPEFEKAYEAAKSEYEAKMETALRFSQHYMDIIGLPFNKVHQMTPIRIEEDLELHSIAGNLKGKYYGERLVFVYPYLSSGEDWDLIEHENYGAPIYIPASAGMKREVIKALQDFKA